MQCLLMGCSTILGVFPTLYLLDYGMDNQTKVKETLLDGFSVSSIHFTALVAGTLATITGPNVRAVLQVRTVHVLCLNLRLKRMSSRSFLTF